VTGGGGAHLSKEKGEQFHHAFVMQVGKDSVTETIVSVPRGSDFEDHLERFAIVEVWPWMARNTVLVCILNAACLVIVFMLIKPFFARPRGERKARARS